MKDKIEIGDEVQDIITGFKGVVVSEHKYLFGCKRFGVQLRKLKEGSVDGMDFDEPSLKLIKKSVLNIKTDNKTKTNGGVSKYSHFTKHKFR